MTEQAPTSEPSKAETAAAAAKAKRSAAAETKKAQRSQPRVAAKRVMVYMRGTSHGAIDGQKRYFDEATADRLVRLGHARRP